MTEELSKNGMGQGADLSLETKLWRLSMIISAAGRIHSSLTLSSVLDTFLDIATGEIGANGGSVFLHGAGDTGLEVKHSHWSGESGPPSQQECSKMADKAMELGEMIVEEGEDDTGTIVTLPLRDEAKASLGVLQIYRDRNAALDASARLFLKELSHFASLSIKNAQYHEDSLHRVELEGALGIAREIQVGTLPKEMPQVSGYDVAGLSRPADETSGDSYDLIGSESGGLTVLLADAMGHGIGPALSVTQVRSMLRVARRIGVGLAETFRNINDQLCEDLAANRFVTAFFGYLDSDTDQLSYKSAGQGPLILFRPATGKFEMLGSTNPPLGIVPMRSESNPLSIDFGPGDTLALITDGVFEAENGDGEELGEDAVKEMIRNTSSLSCAEAAQTILDKVDEYRGEAFQADDITIVLLRKRE
jgi:phosphoserine phosphatase